MVLRRDGIGRPAEEGRRVSKPNAIPATAVPVGSALPPARDGAAGGLPAEEKETGHAGKLLRPGGLRYFWEFAGLDDSVRLVHGHADCIGGNNTGHAWVELPGGVVYDGSFDRFYEAEAYCRIMMATAEVTYTAAEASKASSLYEHFGPWHKNAGRPREPRRSRGGRRGRTEGVFVAAPGQTGRTPTGTRTHAQR